MCLCGRGCESDGQRGEGGDAALPTLVSWLRGSNRGLRWQPGSRGVKGSSVSAGTQGTVCPPCHRVLSETHTLDSIVRRVCGRTQDAGLRLHWHQRRIEHPAASSGAEVEVFWATWSDKQPKHLPWSCFCVWMVASLIFWPAKMKKEKAEHFQNTDYGMVWWAWTWERHSHHNTPREIKLNKTNI